MQNPEELGRIHASAALSLPKNSMLQMEITSTFTEKVMND
jgi:hypothetical protein